MLSVESRVNQLLEDLPDGVSLGDLEKNSIKSAINLIQEITPSDLALIFNKHEDLVRSSSELNWTIEVLNRYLIKLKTKYKTIKDPAYTALVRKGRPSNTAIESEIRLMDHTVTELEESIELLNNIITYIRHLDSCIDKYLWELKDRISFSKM